MRRTDVEKASEMMQMRVQGMSYQKIANVYGVSRQNVCSTIKNYEKALSGERGHGFHIDRIPYRGLYEHFKENRFESAHSFAVKVLDGKENTHFGAKVKYFLKGERDSRFTILQIKRMCEVAGKSFEEVFAERSAEHGQ